MLLVDKNPSGAPGPGGRRLIVMGRRRGRVQGGQGEGVVKVERTHDGQERKGETTNSSQADVGESRGGGEAAEEDLMASKIRPCVVCTKIDTY